MASKGERKGRAAAAGGGEEEQVDRCPVEEVALVVPETDDPTLPVMTFRAWLLGLGSCSLLIFLNTFFTYRTQPLTISAILMQIAVLPAGQFMASVLPRREVKIFRGWGFNLNPGPFNIKEHVIITIFANCGVSIGYSPTTATRSTRSPSLAAPPPAPASSPRSRGLCRGGRSWRRHGGPPRHC